MESLSLSARKKDFSPARRWTFSPSVKGPPSRILEPIWLTYATVPSSFNATIPARKLDRIALSRLILSSTRTFSCGGILLDDGLGGKSERERRAGRETGLQAGFSHRANGYVICDPLRDEGAKVGEIERRADLSGRLVGCG